MATSQLSKDIEHASPHKEYPNGYAQVADFIVQDPENTSTIYRRFDRLAARNLLYLQAKLQRLEFIQDQLDQEDLHSTNRENAKAATSWEDFENQANAGDENARKRMEVADEIERALKKYQKALLLHSEVLGLKRPSENTVKAYKAWFKPEPKFTRLRGHSSHILDDESDLMALCVSVDQDRLTSFVREYFSWPFTTAPPQGRIAYVSDKNIRVFVAVVSTVIAAVLLIGAIVALNYVQSQKWRIALIGVFTMFFAASVGLLTSSRRVEVFAATAAYAAVLVVFVSGNASASIK